MASEYTPNRRYPLYVAADKPNLRDQYNGAIREIDTDMTQALQDSSSVSSALGAGFDAQHTVRMAIESNATAITAEASARQSADSAIEDKLGTGFSSSSTVKDQLDAKASQVALTAEETARQNADSAINAKLGTGFSSSSTVKDQLDAKASQVALTAEINARESADTALGTNITNETTARQNADTALSQRITVLESEYFAVIGDSFSDGSSEWPSIVSAKTGLNYISAAKAGSAFAPTAGSVAVPFITQLQQLSQNANWNKVKHLIVYGCINDWTDVNATSAETKAYISAFIGSFNSLSYKPKLTFVLGNAGFSQRDFPRTYKGYPAYINELVHHVQSLGYSAIPAYAFLAGRRSDVFNSDQLHPNADGQSILASIFTSILNGTYTGHMFSNVYTTAATGWRNVKFYLSVHDTFFTTYGEAVKDGTENISDLNRILAMSDQPSGLWFGRTSDFTLAPPILRGNYRILRVPASGSNITGLRGVYNPLVGYVGMIVESGTIEIADGFQIGPYSLNFTCPII